MDQSKNKSWRCIKPYIPELMKTDCICPEKKKKDNVDASLPWLEDYIRKRGGRLIIVNTNNTDKTCINSTKNNRKTKMGRKTTQWTFQTTNKWNLKGENLDMAKHRKPYERKWITSDSSTKQHHNDYLKAKIENTQHNSRYRLCGNRNETINMPSQLGL